MTATVVQMVKSRSSEVVDRWISEAAAARVVHDVAIDMIEAGMSREQARGVAFATQEYLVGEPGYRGRAEKALAAAGFRNGSITALVQKIESSLHQTQVNAA